MRPKKRNTHDLMRRINKTFAIILIFALLFLIAWLEAFFFHK